MRNHVAHRQEQGLPHSPKQQDRCQGRNGRRHPKHLTGIGHKRLIEPPSGHGNLNQKPGLVAPDPQARE